VSVDVRRPGLDDLYRSMEIVAAGSKSTTERGAEHRDAA
jgi:hypothetical protein